MKTYVIIPMVMVGILSSVLVGCNKEPVSDPMATQQAVSPPTVNVIPVTFEPIPLINEFAGRTEAVEHADVRPQVTGVIDEILYREGSMVEKNQPLYRLSIENYEASQAANIAAVNQAKANVNTAIAQFESMRANQMSAQVQLEQAQSDLQRLAPLVDLKAISQQQFSQAQTDLRTAQAAYANAQAATSQAEANIASAKAAVQSAEAQLSGSQLDLERTIVRAPISGKSDSSAVTAGALVNANQAEPLVTISRLDPIYVNIRQSSAELLALNRQVSNGELQPGNTEVELVLEDGSVYPVKGRLALSEANVDQETGAVTLRAIFANPGQVLLPGMFVTARVTQGVVQNAVLLPQSAIIRTPRGDTQVYIVDQNNIIQVRNVTVNGTHQGNWIVTNGLTSGEQVVVLGGTKVKPEQEVNPKLLLSPVSNASPGPASVKNPNANQ